MNRRAFILRTVGLAAGAASFSLAGCAARGGASPLGGHRIVDLDWQDAERSRAVPARLYLPLQASAGQPVPLVVFSHGLGGSRFGYRYLGSHWADGGIASLHPQHAGSDSGLWRGNPLNLVQRLQAAASESEAMARVLDLRHAVDRILESEWAPMIDPARIAAAGHSYGANTAMLLAGARVSTPLAAASGLRDHRIRAAILISAPPLVGQGPAEQVLGAVRIPTLHVTSVEDTINLPGYRSTVEDRIAIFDAMSASPRTLAVFNAGGHSIFTDRVTRSGPEASARIKGATSELTTIFLEQSLIEGAPRAGADGALAAGDRQPLDRQAPPIGGEAVRQWLSRHEGLVERFVSPVHSLAIRMPLPRAG
jgi:predicted dienelactone hydrolase